MNGGIMKAIVKLSKEYLEQRDVIEIATAEAKNIFKDDSREQAIVIKGNKKILVEKQKVKEDTYKMTAKVEIDLSDYDYLVFGNKGYGAMRKQDIVFVDEEMGKVLDKISG